MSYKTWRVSTGFFFYRGLISAIIHRRARRDRERFLRTPVEMLRCNIGARSVRRENRPANSFWHRVRITVTMRSAAVGQAPEKHRARLLLRIAPPRE